MKQAWQQLDLEGGGLQSMNLRYRQRHKKRNTAMLLWLLFPLGAHRIYLKCVSAIVYPLLTLAGALLYLTGTDYWQIALIPLTAFACYDLFWIEQRVSEFNKALRIELFLGKQHTPPENYPGRYHDDTLSDYIDIKEQERAGIQPVSSPSTTDNPRAPSFTQQEELLKSIARVKREGRSK